MNCRLSAKAAIVAGPPTTTVTRLAVLTPIAETLPRRPYLLFLGYLPLSFLYPLLDNNPSSHLEPPTETSAELSAKPPAKPPAVAVLKRVPLSKRRVACTVNEALTVADPSTVIELFSSCRSVHCLPPSSPGSVPTPYPTDHTLAPAGLCVLCFKGWRSVITFACDYQMLVF